jgi:hypothetical protein
MLLTLELIEEALLAREVVYKIKLVKFPEVKDGPSVTTRYPPYHKTVNIPAFDKRNVTVM